MIDDNYHSTSLCAVELSLAGEQTDMIFTEHVVWHDGTELSHGLASREHGTNWQFDNVAEVLGI